MLKNMKIGPKLILSFSVATLIMVVVGVVGWIAIGNLTGAMGEIATVRLPSIEGLMVMNRAQLSIVVGERGLFNTRMMDPTVRQAQYAYIEKARGMAQEGYALYEPLPQTAEESVMWKQFVPLWEGWLQKHEKVVELSKRKDQLVASGKSLNDPAVTEVDDQVFQAAMDSRSAYLASENILLDIINLNEEIAAEEVLIGEKTASGSKMMLAIAMLVGLAACMTLGVLLARAISRPLVRMAGAAEQLARGDIDQHVEARSRDEIGVLAEAFRKMITAQKGKAEVAEQIARGNLAVDAKAVSEKDVLGNAMVTMKGSIQALAEDVNLLAEAAVEGRLKTRADEERHQGDWRKIVHGVNQTLDAVVTPINEAAKTLSQLADYDLRARMSGEYRGDYAQIKESLNATAVVLHDALSQVAEASDQVSSASTQIASSSQQVAEGSSEQASSLEETSSSLEEMASMTKQNADNTQQARGLAQQTREMAEQGSSAMESMLVSMGKIRQSAEGTAEIIRDINEIAFQTNLLALNAAVEAARAGDAGRGFAVVAEEVRNLALRSKDAAARTEELIKQSVTLAGEGETKTNEVSGSLGEMVESVGKVTDIVAEIAAASQEQAKGIEQVNRAVAEMDKVVQAAAANAEESSSAAQELAGQSQELAAMVGRFQLNRR
ncbi:MAG: HAMP domain-containing protein, partial [Candidatus Eisenbacteria bacterium]|nr:HAMP domain-containing protein [Candidatus Eisenbacteria bacterium]